MRRVKTASRYPGQPHRRRCVQRTRSTELIPAPPPSALLLIRQPAPDSRHPAIHRALTTTEDFSSATAISLPGRQVPSRTTTTLDPPQFPVRRAPPRQRQSHLLCGWRAARRRPYSERRFADGRTAVPAHLTQRGQPWNRHTCRCAGAASASMDLRTRFPCPSINRSAASENDPEAVRLARAKRRLIARGGWAASRFLSDFGCVVKPMVTPDGRTARARSGET